MKYSIRIETQGAESGQLVIDEQPPFNGRWSNSPQGPFLRTHFRPLYTADELLDLMNWLNERNRGYPRTRPCDECPFPHECWDYSKELGLPGARFQRIGEFVSCSRGDTPLAMPHGVSAKHSRRLHELGDVAPNDTTE